MYKETKVKNINQICKSNANIYHKARVNKQLALEDAKN